MNQYQQKKKLEITYRGTILGNEHSLEYIFKTYGTEPDKTPNFKYRRSQSLGIVHEGDRK